MEAVGLAPGTRYRCEACGNLTRFDVESVEKVRRFWHADLAGAGIVEEEERPEVTVTRVTCRWCGSSDAIQVIPVPGAVGAAPAATSGRNGASAN